MASNKPPGSPKKKPTGAYAVGYCQPPKKGQFTKGQSGNPSGLPKGLPTPQEILVQEAARVIKVQIGDQVVSMSKHRALIRKLIDIGTRGDIAAVRLALAYLTPAHAELVGVAANTEPPLTEAEIAVFQLTNLKSEGGENA